MKIGEAALATGVSVRALRYYEDEGLIEPGRHANGYRDYCTPTIAAVRRVRSLLDVGVPVRLIREILPHLPDEQDGSEAVCDEFLGKVAKHRDRLEQRIAQLEEQRSALDKYVREARAGRSTA